MRIKHIDILRGLAALMVTIFHLTGSTGISKTASVFGRYGSLGVQVFFVISGFVLPYSLYKSGYQLKNFFSFLIKRIIRIHPAYIVAILIGIVLAVAAHRKPITWDGALLHLVFLNTSFGYNDTSAVFWTLKIEFGFYILVALLFSHFIASSYRSAILIIIILILVLLNVAPLLIPWLTFFALGILIFNKQCCKMNPVLFWGMAVIITIVNLKVHGLAGTIAGCIAFLFILFGKIEYFQKQTGQILLWLGMISYSLYLVHWDIGRVVVGISRHIPVIGNSESLRVCAGVGASIICAYGLYKLVERPSIKLANKIEYKP